MKVTWLFAAAALLVGSSVKADQYFGVNYSMVDLDGPEPTAIQVRYGSSISDDFDIEGRLLIGAGDDSFSGFDFELDNAIGVYTRYNFAKDSAVNVYGLLGITRVKASASFLNASASESETDLSYGLGADIRLSDDTVLNVEWASLIDKDATEATALNLGVSFSF